MFVLVWRCSASSPCRQAKKVYLSTMWRSAIDLTTVLLLCLTTLPTSIKSVPVDEKEKTSKFWNDAAKEEIRKSIEENVPIVGVAKNVILFLGDGMGVQSVTTGRILAGQLNGENGENYELSFDKFPHVALSKTYNVDHQTPDSAGTGTAYLCGVKTNMGTLGVNAKVTRTNCASAPPNTHINSILRWSIDKGKSAGVVTTTRVTHATPGASYSHTPERDWEGSVPKSQAPCKDIAQQLVRENDDIQVILGGGRRNFFPYNYTDPEEVVNPGSGRRDNLNLVQEWMDKQSNKTKRYQYVWNQTAFYSVDPAHTDYLLGLFNPSHMQYEVDRSKDKAGEPSLAEMTRKAIQILKKNDKGFFLLVEGGKIDLAHHDNLAGKSLHDVVAFSDAIAVAADPKLLNEKDTLIVTTADHSHAFAMAGYPGRGNNILGLVADSKGITKGKDGLPYTTLLYSNGPGGNGLNNGMVGRQNLTNVNTSDPEYRQQAIVPLVSETHGGEDVAIFARGPMSHLFHSVHEQNYIAHVMAYASCVGAYEKDKDCAAALMPTSGSSGGIIGEPGVGWFRFLLLLVVTRTVWGWSH